MKCSPLSLSGENGIQWQDLFDEKLNKDFKWAETFEAALGTGDKDALEKVYRTIIILFILIEAMKSLYLWCCFLAWFARK